MTFIYLPCKVHGMEKSPNTERIGIPHDDSEGRAYRGKARVWRPSRWNNDGLFYYSYKSRRMKYRPKRKEVK